MDIYSGLPGVSIVVIGHNESLHLAKCFKCINELDYDHTKLEIIYVDSNSNDNSVEIAAGYADKIVAKHALRPTAGLAFNQGIAESKYTYIQILGGDMYICKDFLINAVQAFDRYSDVAAVEGRFTVPDLGGWEKILSYRAETDKRTDEHFVSAPGGGVFRKESLLLVNGYDERIKKGQETDIGVRLSEQGLKILSIKEPQGLNNFDKLTYFGVILRFYNEGKNAGFNFLLSCIEPENKYLKSIRRSVVTTLLANTLTLIILLIALIMNLKLIFLAISMQIVYYLYSVLSRRGETIKLKKYRTLCFLLNSVHYFGVLVILVQRLFKGKQKMRLYSPMKGVAGLSNL